MAGATYRRARGSWRNAVLATQWPFRLLAHPAGKGMRHQTAARSRPDRSLRSYHNAAASSRPCAISALRRPKRDPRPSTAIRRIGLHPRVVADPNHATMRFGSGSQHEASSQRRCQRPRRSARDYYHLRYHQSGRHRPVLRAVRFGVPVKEPLFFAAHVLHHIAARLPWDAWRGPPCDLPPTASLRGALSREPGIQAAAN